MVTMVAGNWTNSYIGKSTDEKPIVNVPNASTFYEIDTQELYAFDAENRAWLKQ